MASVFRTARWRVLACGRCVEQFSLIPELHLVTLTSGDQQCRREEQCTLSARPSCAQSGSALTGVSSDLCAQWCGRQARAVPVALREACWWPQSRSSAVCGQCLRGRQDLLRGTPRTSAVLLMHSPDWLCKHPHWDQSLLLKSCIFSQCLVIFHGWEELLLCLPVLLP